MPFLALNGQRASALAHYEAFKKILIEELSAKPSLETERLYEDILVGKIGYASEAEANLEAANPYKGLRAFQEADAADFYGRQALVERLLGCFTHAEDALSDHGESRFLAVVGPSGRVKLIIGLLAAFYDRPLVHPGLGGLMQSRTEVVLPMMAEELSSAIQKPSEKVGVVFEEGLVACIVAEGG
jgi:hypothetical protein